jgi:ADP-ribosyl-[dinitrogen reductase] hydrolase
MLGAIIGDIVGSTFESENHRSPFFELFRKNARFTDDTVCTVAIADILEKNYPDNLNNEVISNSLRLWCCTYLNRGFGSMFYQWIANAVNRPYGSYGNGALMRISPVALFAVSRGLSLEIALDLAQKLTEVTHNHPQALKAVKIYTELLYMFLKYRLENNNFITTEEAKKIIIEKLIEYEYAMPEKIDKYRVTIEFDLTCDTSLGVALAGILETDNFDDVLYQVVSVGGDSDTYAAIAGALAESIYGIPETHLQAIKPYFRPYDEDLLIAIEMLYKPFVI